MPQRIQRKRTKGWRMPPNTVYVGRGSMWGNPYRAGDFLHIDGRLVEISSLHARTLYRDKVVLFNLERSRGRGAGAKAAREWAGLISKLKGKNLACWCKLGSPCHADVLLELANESASLTAGSRGS